MSEQLNRRVGIESYLLQCYEGKKPLPNKEVCRWLALRLGTPQEHWDDWLKGKPPN